jgi:hypothetical protein
LDWTKLEAHAAANAFPRMVDSELQSLADDINTNGQIFPIVLTKEKPSRIVNGEEVLGEPQKILDGRNRHAAYLMLKKRGIELEPRIETYEGALSPRDYVRSVNWERMHLSQAERIRIGVLMIPKAQAEARARQATGKAPEVEPDKVDAVTVSGKASAVASKAVGVSPRTLERAARVKLEAPEAFEKITQGVSAVNTEYAKLSPKPSRRSQTKNEAEQMECALAEFFGVLTPALRQLKSKLDVREVPASLDERKRGQYLNTAMEVNAIIRKLQGEKG